MPFVSANTTPAELLDRLTTAVAVAAESAVRRARPTLSRLVDRLVLAATWLQVAVPPLARRAGRAVIGAVAKVQAVVAPAWGRVGLAVLRGVQHVEERLVPGLTAVVVGLAVALTGMERRAVPALATTGSRTAGAVLRGQAALAAAVSAGGRGLMSGVQRVEARAAGVLTSPPVRRERHRAVEERLPEPREIEGVPEPGAGPGWLASGGYLPPPALLRAPAAPGVALRARAASAFASAAGLLMSAGLVVLVIALTAQATVGEAIAHGDNALSAELRLPPDARLSDLEEPSSLFASDGMLLDRLEQETSRRIVTLEQIPQPVRQAVITAEDARFYSHDGYDVEGIGRAAFANLERGDITQGASTITQQLARTAPEVGTEREGIEAFWRKFREIAYAVALEERFSKDELLAQYLNQMNFGERAYGLSAAAEEYFGVTDVGQLTVEQGALLAAHLRRPSENARNAPDIALFRRNAVLDGMVIEGYLTAEAAEAAKATPITVLPPSPEPRPYDFIADAVVQEFLTAPEFAQFGATLEERRHALWFGGLSIRTSLDPRLQDIATEALAATYSGDPAQPTGAIAAVEPGTGRILACQGGLAYGVEQFDLCRQARRQPGSAAKPFTYAEAVRQGFPTNIPLTGASPSYYEDEDGWGRGEGGLINYGNASYGGLTMATALARSVNTATVQLAKVVGPDNVFNLMDQMGIDVDAAMFEPSRNASPRNTASILGGFAAGVTPLEMASAYGTFANDGVHVRPHFIDRVEDRTGTMVYQSQIPGSRVFEPPVNATVISLMTGSVRPGGTAPRVTPALAPWPVAGKTGTTNDNVDAWFVGYTPTLAAASWMGVRQPRSMGRASTGGSVPTTVWTQFMQRALEGQAASPFPQAPAGGGRVASGQPVTVPEVVGRPQAAALQALTATKLFGQVRTAPARSRAGTVVAQGVRGGQPASAGDVVVLTVSSGPAPPPPLHAPAPQAPAPQAPAPQASAATTPAPATQPAPG